METRSTRTRLLFGLEKASENALQQNLMLATLDEAAEFFERGPRKVKRLKQRDHSENTWVEPEVLVDFLAVERLEVTALNDTIAP